MSIAVSALVRPSRALRLVLVGAGLALLGAGCVAGLADPSRYLGGPLPGCALALAAAVLLGSTARTPKMHRIDISGTGELRVTVQQELRLPSCADAPAAELLPGSVVWPLLMLLRCRVPVARAAGQAGSEPRAVPLVVHVWRDSVDADTWRALAVALAVVGRRADADEGSGTIR